MSVRYKRITRNIFLILNILVSIAFLLACLAPYLNPREWWFISLIGLGFALVIITMIAFIFFWLVFKPKFMLISLIPLFIGFKSVLVFFAFHIPNKWDYETPKQSLRIAHWNVVRFTEWKKNNNA